MTFIKIESLITLLQLTLLGIYHITSSIVLYLIPRGLRRKKNIQGQKVLITGAGSGLGRQLALEFSRHATCLVLVDINRHSLVETEKLLDPRSKVFLHVCDVSDYRSVYEMAEEVRRDAGDVDILINNAGIVVGKYLVDLPEDRIVKTMEVNTLAHFWTCKAFLPAMMERNRGHLVSIASIAGKGGGPRASDYCASKFAAVGLAESLEVEMRERGLDGIKVTIVCPAHINTGLFQGVKMTIGSMMSPVYVAKEIVIGILEEKEIIFIPNIYRVLLILKEIFPRAFLLNCYKITGDLRLMQNFTGRQTEKINLNETEC